MLGKDKLGFNVTDADTIAASDSVGAFLRASDGTLLTHTDVGGKKSLDVNVANSITTTNAANFAEDAAHSSGATGTHILAVRNDAGGALTSADGDYSSLTVDANGRLYTNIADGGNSITVDATNLDIRDLSSASDSVAAVQSGTWNIGTVTTLTSITNAVTVTATNLDIRDLAFATDSVTAHQGGTWTIDSITNDVNIADGGNSITVDATNLDIRDLTHVSDSVKIGDGTNFLAFVGSTGIARTADYHTAAANSAVSIDTTAGGVALVASALSNRTNLIAQNLGNRNIYVGVGTVTAANGLRIAPGGFLEARIGAALSLKAIADSGTQDVRVLELA
jgi:hypothetical protein